VRTAKQRVVIIGGGILGTMHALFAVRAGATVVHLERYEQPRGASVRNFGLVLVSGRAPGADLALALRARSCGTRSPPTCPAPAFARTARSPLRLAKASSGSLRRPPPAAMLENAVFPFLTLQRYDASIQV